MADINDDYSLDYAYQSTKRNLVRPRKRRGIPDEGDDFVLPPTRGPRAGPSGGMSMSGPSGAGSSGGGIGGMGPGMSGSMIGGPMGMAGSHRHRKQAKPNKGFGSGNFPWQPFLPPNSQGKERRVAQMNAIKLSNMLKLPKAHRWVFYEWFYSNLDRPIFLGENDFRACLRDSFPQLKTRRLTRTQWSMIRRLMGKPRRCSIAFFAEERRTLHEKRDKIRLLQARRSIEGELLRDLPDDMHVPMPLIIGTRVHARCRFPHDGLYSGIVDAIDTLNHSYRVTFDKSSLGTRTVPDYEVLSIEPQETIPLSAYKAQHKASRNLFMSPARLLAQSAIQGVRQHLQHARQSAGLADVGVNDCPLCQSDTAMMTSPFKSTPLVGPADPVLGSGAAGRPQLLLNESDTYGGYPMKFLVMVTKLSKILEVKKRCVEELRVLNEEAEKKISTQESISLDFQHNYATVIVQLDKLNKELKQYLEHVLQYANEIGQEHGVQPLEQTTDIKQRCDDEAYELVTRTKNVQGHRLRNLKNLDLITKLTGMLVQIRTLAENKASPFEFSCIQESLRDLKSAIHSTNIHAYENNVETHVNHILSGLSQLGNLNAFQYSHPPSVAQLL